MGEKWECKKYAHGWIGAHSVLVERNRDAGQNGRTANPLTLWTPARHGIGTIYPPRYGHSHSNLPPGRRNLRTLWTFAGTRQHQRTEQYPLFTGVLYAERTGELNILIRIYVVVAAVQRNIVFRKYNSLFIDLILELFELCVVEAELLLSKR